MPISPFNVWCTYKHIDLRECSWFGGIRNVSLYHLTFWLWVTMGTQCLLWEFQRNRMRQFFWWKTHCSRDLSGLRNASFTTPCVQSARSRCHDKIFAWNLKAKLTDTRVLRNCYVAMNIQFQWNFILNLVASARWVLGWSPQKLSHTISFKLALVSSLAQASSQPEQQVVQKHFPKRTLSWGAHAVMLQVPQVSAVVSEQSGACSRPPVVTFCGLVLAETHRIWIARHVRPPGIDCLLRITSLFFSEDSGNKIKTWCYT